MNPHNIEVGLCPPWMTVVQSKLGLRGSSNGRDDVPTAAVQNMLKRVGATATTSEKDGAVHVTYWCSAFANACLEEADIAGTKNAAAKSFLSWGSALNQPRFGAICVLKRKGGNHVSFYVDTLADGHLLLLGGNQGNMVRFSRFPLDQVHDRGIRWPSLLHHGKVQENVLRNDVSIRAK